jgi:sulfane dehydrogenase subunit SoxC
MDGRDLVSYEELQLATRNHGLPLEALRFSVTPVGLHYVLTHYDIPVVAPEGWCLTIDGLVTRPQSLKLEAIRARRPVITLTSTMECAGNGRARMRPRPISQPWLLEAVGTSTWTGTPLRGLLADASVKAEAVEVVFEGLDAGVEGGVKQAYARSLTMADALADDVLLAYDMNGSPLPPQHGYPLRLIVPGWYGMTNVKWLSRITAVAEPFTGYQQSHGYRVRSAEEDPGESVTRMAPRALMIPPGIPDFLTRRRFVSVSPIQIDGRAWSGLSDVIGVTVSSDGGHTWSPAQLGDRVGRYGWRSWTYLWEPPSPGDYELCCSAHDAEGTHQPYESTWNLGGYANNSIQRVAVTAR